MSALSRTDARALAIAAGALAITAATIGSWYAHSGALLLAGGSGALIALGRLSGLVLMLLVMAQLVLASRAPFLDWTDRLSAPRLHRFLGFSIAFALLSHVLLIVAGYAAGGSWLGQFVSMLTWEDILPALLGGLAMLAIGVVSVRAIRSRLRYEWWYRVHLSLYAAIYLAIGHQLAAGDMAEGVARLFWIGLMVASGGTLLVYRVLRPALSFAQHRFVVERVVRESPSTVSIYLTGWHLDTFRFQAGQYAYLTFLARGFSTHHPFSFSNPPGRRTLRFTIKSLGDFTSRIEHIRPGTPVVIDGPLGHLTPSVARSPQRCLIAGGIGITPMAALAAQEPTRSFVLVANKTRSDAPLLRELTEAGIPVHAYYSEDLPRKRLDAHEVLRACPDVHSREVYICGPDGMMRDIASGLISLGIPRRRIHTEQFGL